MHSIGVNVLDAQQCQQTLNTKYQDVLQHYNPNTICGFSKVDQCLVSFLLHTLISLSLLINDTVKSPINYLNRLCTKLD